MSSNRYIQRSVFDENFAGTLMLLGPSIAWGASLKEGARLSFNDINLVQLPMECAEALLRWMAAYAPDPVGRDCKAAVDQIDLFRAAFSRSRTRKRASGIEAAEPARPDRGSTEGESPAVPQGAETPKSSFPINSLGSGEESKTP